MQNKALIRSVTFLLSGLLILFVASFFSFFRFHDIYLNRAASSIENTINRHENTLDKLLDDKELITAVISSGKEIPVLLDNLQNKPYFLFVYENSNIKFWSGNEMVIRNINLLPKEGRRMVYVGNGYYEMIRRDYPNNISALGVIPVYRQYDRENEFLRSGFTFKSEFLNRVKLTLREDVPGMKPISSINGEFLFGVVESTDKKPISDYYYFILQLIGFVLLIVAVSYLFGYFYSRINRKILVIFLLLLFMKGIDQYINEIGKFAFVKYADLFSDTLFASRIFGNSLGQFILRCFLVLWFFLLLNKNSRFADLNWVKNQKFYSQLLLVLATSCFYLLVLNAITSLVMNSTISFEFFNFNYLNWYSLLGLLGLAFLLISLYLFLDISVRLMNLKHFTVWWCSVPIIIIWEIVILHNAWWMGILLSSFFISLVSLVYFSWKDRYALFRFLTILFIMAAILSLMMVSAIREKNGQLANALAEDLLVERSSMEEIGFLEAVGDMSKDKNIKAYFKSPYINNLDLNNRIKTKYLRRYDAKYEIQSYATRPEGVPLTGDIPNDFEKLLEKREWLVPTSVEHLFYVKNTEGGYLGKVPLYSDSILLGHINFRLTQKLFTSFSAYPVLLQNTGTANINQYDKFDFAVYDSIRLVRSKGNYEKNIYLENVPELSDTGILLKSDNSWYWQQKKESRSVIVSWKWANLAFISLFSYMVFLLLVLIFFLEISGLTLGINKSNPFLKDFLKPSLQRNIQSSMIILVMLSLMIVGIVSIFFFSYQYDNYYNIKAARQVNGLSKDISYLWQQEDTLPLASLQAKLLANTQRLSEVSEVDINFFNTEGELLGTTQPEIFIKGLVSEKINPQANYQLNTLKKGMWQNEEKIGKLNFTSVYLRVETNNGRLLGFLQCPFYEKQRNLKEDISFFMVSFVNLYVLLLLIAAIVAVALSGSITQSLTAIREHMGTFRIGRKNKPIALYSKDEIGALVSEYNIMIKALEESAEKLAQSEREDAWKEMAKQVAHEIKNPLTPMKLSIQHLQRAVTEGHDHLPELTAKISSSLVEQIDALAEIASAFSDFARMPSAQHEKLNLQTILQTATGLFQEEDVSIQCDFPKELVFISADKNQLLRVFNNLIKNAVQSIEEKQVHGVIKIKISNSEDRYIISIEDNGNGISKDKQEKIFQPNFTTKSSGTGLGLAISKNIIERMGGRIWMKSTVGSGSVFYIELPEIIEK